jgi:FHS family Na+ dependent glucose MFS transporter 1
MVKTAVYYIVFLIIGLSASIMGPTLPWLADNVAVPLSQISILFSAKSLGGLLGSAFGGRLFDRRPAHPVAAGLLLIMAITLALIPLGRQLWVLAVIVFLLGVGDITLDLGGNTLLMWVHGSRVAPFMNGLHFFFGVGAFLAPVLVALAISGGSVQAAYWVLALIILPVAVVLLRLSSPTAPNHAETTVDSRQVSRRLAFLVAFFFLLYVGAEVSFGGWIYSYAVALDLASEVGAAYLTSAFWGALTIGRLLAVPISTRVGPRYILLVGLLGSLACLATILLLRESSLALQVSVFGLGLCMAPVFPTMLSFAERRMAITGQVTGWFFVGASLGGMILPWVSGQLFTRFSPYATMAAIAGAVLGALIVYLILTAFSQRKYSGLRQEATPLERMA